VLVFDTNDKEHKVTMFDEVVQQVLGYGDAESGENLDDKLLTTPPLRYTIKDEVITSVSKVINGQE